MMYPCVCGVGGLLPKLVAEAREANALSIGP